MARSKLLEDVRDTLRLRHYSYRTEKSYIYWIRKFILFHQKRHPAEMGKDEIRNYLTFLASLFWRTSEAESVELVDHDVGSAHDFFLLFGFWILLVFFLAIPFSPGGTVVTSTNLSKASGAFWFNRAQVEKFPRQE